MSLPTPLIITNFKTYAQGCGTKAVELAQIAQKVAHETGASLAIAVQAVDIFQVAQKVDIPVLAQHVDPIECGASTGHILPEAIKEAGAAGTLLNHSEHRLEWDVLAKTIERAKEVGLITVVCAKNPEEGQRIAQEFDPDFVAVEPPELIGGDISVSTAQPEVISNSAKLIGSEKLIVGAGIKNSEDVRIAIELGAIGMLPASGVVKAEDPAAVLRDLVSGLTY